MFQHGERKWDYCWEGAAENCGKNVIFYNMYKFTYTCYVISRRLCIFMYLLRSHNERV